MKNKEKVRRGLIVRKIEDGIKTAGVWIWGKHLIDNGVNQVVEKCVEVGINRILPYACMGKLPFDYYADYLPLLIEYSHKNNIEVHLWFDELRPESVGENRENYLQKDENGNFSNILCPANPYVVEMNLRKLNYLLGNLNLDGIHYEDTLVFASTHTEGVVGGKVCYCPFCSSNAPIGKPDWMDWKRKKSEAFVKGIHDEIKRAKPEVKWSLAARLPYKLENYKKYSIEECPYLDDWKSYDCYNYLGIDWGTWCKKGLLDWIAPMCYTNNFNFLKIQTGEVVETLKDSKVRPYMGLGIGENWTNPAMLKHQLKIVADMGIKGVNYFEWNSFTKKHWDVLKECFGR